MPDFVEETFYQEPTLAETTNRACGRLLEWRWDRDPEDGHFEVEMALLLRDTDGTCTRSTSNTR